MLLFYSNLRENDVRERAKASDYSRAFLWGLLWGTMSKSVGIEKPHTFEAHYGTDYQGN